MGELSPMLFMGELLYSGKVKQVWSTDDPDIIRIQVYRSDFRLRSGHPQPHPPEGRVTQQVILSLVRIDRGRENMQDPRHRDECS